MASGGVCGVGAQLALATFLLVRGCSGDESCASRRDFADGGGSSSTARELAVVPGSVVDCPDGLARCSDGVVEASRLGTIALPCKAPEGRCACPWDEVAACPAGCAADGVEIVVERARAPAQLCAPIGGSLSSVVTRTATREESACDESELYRCAGGMIIDCTAHRAVAACRHGCFMEGAFVRDEVQVEREAAFALLCSR